MPSAGIGEGRDVHGPSVPPSGVAPSHQSRAGRLGEGRDDHCHSREGGQKLLPPSVPEVGGTGAEAVATPTTPARRSLRGLSREADERRPAVIGRRRENIQRLADRVDAPSAVSEPVPEATGPRGGSLRTSWRLSRDCAGRNRRNQACERGGVAERRFPPASHREPVPTGRRTRKTVLQDRMAHDVSDPN